MVTTVLIYVMLRVTENWILHEFCGYQESA
jgi:hypothetical protein